MINRKVVVFSFLSNLYLALTTFNFIYASAGGSMVSPIILSLFKNILFLGLILLNKNKIELPRYFNYYLLFLGIMIVHFLVVGGSLKLLFIFISAALYYLNFYNFKKEASEHLPQIIHIIAICMAFLFLTTLDKGMNQDVTESLFHPTATSRHNHLGDIFAIAASPLIYSLLVKPKAKNIIPLTTYCVFVAISFSRSAIMSLITVVVFLSHKLKVDRQSIKINPILIICSILFVVFGLFKHTLFSRPYYQDSINLLFTYPFGIGLGNFSKFYPNIAVVHSLILEILVSFGIFSFVFFVWLYKTIKMVLYSNSNLILQSVFLSLLINLTFDRTYLVPSIVWLMFAALALISPQSVERKSLSS